ncbi:Uncharacterised protein [Streptococcus massiliensis]|uniref:Uncharacterized protein n=1 Tax=Streptococcus massiliensis TaxID=313439 RepID=A0A380L2D6_9STRE|nr:Uncharacterised protein [Streptococcus massiliensis]
MENKASRNSMNALKEGEDWERLACRKQVQSERFFDAVTASCTYFEQIFEVANFCSSLLIFGMGFLAESPFLLW